MEILRPVIAMMLLTIAVWFYMYYNRISYMLKNKIRAQAFSSPERVNSLLPEDVNAASNNLKNLFELPVLFYVVCLAHFGLGLNDPVMVWMGWAYVALRAMHSIIHCLNGSVMARFLVYLFSSIGLWIMVARLAGKVFTN